VRQDLLDEVVWAEIVRLLEDPQLIQRELERRLATAREADPIKRREETVRRDLIRIRKNIDRLLAAYQEGLLSLDELRERMPQLRQRQQADNAELQAIVNQSVDSATCVLPKPSPRSSRDCDRRRMLSTYRNGNASRGCSSRKSSSAMTRYSSGTAFRCPRSPSTARQPEG
jgi:hypothetical protein